MELLERETELAQLSAAFDALAGGGAGRTVLVLGEAGVGKTSLVQSLLELRRACAETYWGACEALFSPRPLGPIGDFAAALPPGLASQVHAGQTYNGLFPAFLAFLRERARPVVLVIEDAHWADEATLDFIKYIGRRIASTRALLVVTLRDDEVGLDHPLRRVLGDLPAASTRRIALSPLSRSAVEQLARAAGCDPGALYQSTGGNPFYVSETLAARGAGVPASVRDAVLARFGRLAPAARRVVELVAIEPGRIERAVVDVLLPGADAAVRDACDGGVLRADPGWLAFRHEIARRCIELELPADRRLELHAQVLEYLRRREDLAGGLAREVHHAIGAGRHADVIALAPRAAQEAARIGSHREAAALLERVLAIETGIDADRRAALLEEAAGELQKTGALATAITRRQQALQLRRAAGDRLREGVNLRLLGVLHRQSSGDTGQYLHCARAAVEVLEPLGPGGELAKAYASLSHVCGLRSEFDAAIDLGERAVRMAQASADPAALALALNRLGTARIYKHDDPDARKLLEQALALALDARFEGLAAETYVFLQTGTLIHHDHAFALEVGRRGIAYCEARDLDGYALSLRIRCAFSLLNLGRWDEGEREYVAVLQAPQLSPLLHATCLFMLRRQQVRRGVVPEAVRSLAALQGDVDDYWRNVEAQVHTLAVEFKPAAIAAACAEAAWLRGDRAAADEAIRIGLAEVLAARDGRLAGPLLVWQERLGLAPSCFDAPLLAACEHELAGRRAEAAGEWARLQNPFEEALVLAFGDETQMRTALARFEALGAARAVGATRARLRALGVRGVERGPYGHARSHAFGFTRRESEVAALLCEGLSNAAIAQRLQRSGRTIEHHVAGVLGKLGVASRAQAVLKLSNFRHSAKN